MSEVDLSLTFRELVVLVARMFGMADTADGEWNVPTDAGNLAFCKDIVRQAIRRVVNDHPTWRWLNGRFTVDLVAGTAEYSMPWWFDGATLSSNLTYAAGGPRMLVRVVTEEQIREMVSATGGETGDPRCIAFYMPDRTAIARHPRVRPWKALVYPTPTTAYTITGKTKMKPTLPWDLDDAHCAGSAMNTLMECACRAIAEMEADKQNGPMEQRYQEALARAKELDLESGPRNLGPSSDPEDDGWRPPTFGQLSTNGVFLN